eukprot:202047-Rhodomonas_salina.1
MARAIDTLDRKIRRGANSDFTERSQNWYNKGGKKELKRFFDKKTPPTGLEKILPKDKARHYPAVLTTSKAGLSAFAEYVGDGLTGAMSQLREREMQGEWWLLRLRSTQTEVRVRNRGEEWDIQTNPLTTITEFLLEHQQS